jgi:hypothetical protein
MNKYIVSQGNQATTIIVTDDKEKSEQDLFCTLIPITEDLLFGIGWYWDGNTFTPPEEPDIIEE